MSSKLRILIWEQARVAVPIAVGVFAVGAALQLFFAFLGHGHGLAHEAAMNMSRVVSLLYIAVMAGFMFMRFDAHGHLVGHFEQRLARLPIDTLPLVAIPLFFRALLVGVTCLCFGLVQLLCFGDPVDFTWITGGLVLYLVAQSAAWAKGAVTGLVYLVVALPFGVVVFQFAGVLPFRLLDMGAAFANGLVSPIAFPAVLAVTFGLALVGVRWHRRDERHGLPTPAEVAEWLRSLSKPRTRPFRSPAEALLWYEWRRYGWRLPVTSALILCVLIFAMLAYYELLTANPRSGETHTAAEIFSRPGGEQSVFVQVAPFLALVLGAAATGLYSGTGKVLKAKPPEAMKATRPITSTDLAWAKLITLGRAWALTLFGAALLSTLGVLVFGQAEVQVLRLAWQNGEVGVFALTAYVLGPILVAACISWCAISLASSRWLLIPIPLLLLYASVYGAFDGYADILNALTLVFLDLALLAVPGVYAFLGWRRGLLPLPVLAVCGGVWLVLGLLFWGTGGAPDGLLLLFSLGLAGLLVLPILATPLQIERGRSG